MELRDLVGRHNLTGVDRYNEEIQRFLFDGYEACEYLSFRLDGRTYTAIEDPEDGYRSTMRELIVTDHAPTNTFPAVPVIAQMAEAGPLGDDILELVHADTGEVFLRVGTNGTDDWYPRFVAKFNATALGQVPPE